MTPLSLSSYVFFKIDLYVRAYTWRKKLLSVGIFTQRVSFEYTIVENILPNHVIKMSKGYFYSICKKHFNSHRHICFFKLILS